MYTFFKLAPPKKLTYYILCDNVVFEIINLNTLKKEKMSAKNIFCQMKSGQDILFGENKRKHQVNNLSFLLALRQGILLPENKIESLRFAVEEIEKKIKVKNSQAIVVEKKFATNLLLSIGFKIFRHLASDGKTYGTVHDEHVGVDPAIISREYYFSLPIIGAATIILSLLTYAIITGKILGDVAFGNIFISPITWVSSMVYFFILSRIIKKAFMTAYIKKGKSRKEMVERLKSVKSEELIDLIFKKGSDERKKILNYGQVLVKINFSITKLEDKNIINIFDLANEFDGKPIIISHKKAISFEVLGIRVATSKSRPIIAIETKKAFIFFPTERKENISISEEERKYTESIKKIVSEKKFDLFFFN